MSKVKPRPQRHKSKALIPQLGGDITLYHNIFQTKELDKQATCAKKAQVAADGKIRQLDIYNLKVECKVLTLNLLNSPTACWRNISRKI